MPSKLSEVEKSFNAARNELLSAARKADADLTTQLTKLDRQLKTANAKTKKLVGQLDAAQKQFKQTNNIASARKLEKFKTDLIDSRAEARVLRERVKPLKEDKAEALGLLRKAKAIDGAIAKTEKAWSRKKTGKTRAKRSTKKKAVTKKTASKKPVTKKQAPKKKATAKKAASRKKAAHRKPTVAPKKPTTAPKPVAAASTSSSAPRLITLPGRSNKS